MSERALAVIPARGGSKRIPRKNLREFAGHPLIAWSIAAARNARCVERVVVSTDDDEIARAAVAYGAEVPFRRPAELAEDATTDLPVIRHALEWLAEHDRYTPEIVVQLRPTSPLRPPSLVDEAVEALRADAAADSVRAVTLAGQTPYKMWTCDGARLTPLLAPAMHEPYNAPRQMLPSVYWQTGHIDAFRERTLRERQSLTGTAVRPVFVDGRYAVDIDEPVHWRMGEALLRDGDLDVVYPSARA